MDAVNIHVLLSWDLEHAHLHVPMQALRAQGIWACSGPAEIVGDPGGPFILASHLRLHGVFAWS